MKILPTWLREFVDLTGVDDRQLAADLTQAGLSVEGIATEGGQTVFEVEITPNRPDAMNHYGIAREASAIYDKELKPLTAQLPTTNDQRPTTPFPIQIEDALGCARYCARVIRGVKIAASPAKIAQRLAALDASAISNAVDASNYTLQQMGHPTHAFDLDLLVGGKILVRRARAGETLKTLDGVDRKLDPDDLIIADAEKPVALAGVMGGFDSMITERTKNVLIESAWFDPASVRRTARRHGMHTDASHRFERGADIGAAPLACDLVAQLILETAGGKLEGGLIDARARALGLTTIALREAEVRRHLGQRLRAEEIARILERLGFAVTEREAEFTVDVPTWRLDVEQEIDLIEEIARIYGYNKFPNTLPAFSGSVVELPNAAKDEQIRRTLLALGYNEAISLTFVGPADAGRFSHAEALALANPVNDEAGALRTSLVPGMLDMLGWNLNRGVESARLFERGNVFEQVEGGAVEPLQLAIGATGQAQPASPHEPSRAYSFYDLKGVVEQLLAGFAHNTVSLDRDTRDYFHPGRCARVKMDGATVARFGEIHPDVAAVRKLRQPVFVAEIILDRLYRHELRQPNYQPLPRFPAVGRDFSFVFDDDVSCDRIQSAVTALGIAELASFSEAEIFRGGSVPAGKYSVLLRATFQSPERTLRDDEVGAWAQRIIVALTALDGTLRA